ncbi:mitochondrial carrier [Exidia glandulosa HHB12029]|uniref:Mitochondrial carrier n=1 Tax=Exidia glandulosa HHB12029 TaxID=1314781 RepID=A0A165CZQ7_EXIGL|nr:mitochondrial carrier [Exidia glandulosa HHB12029]
MSGHNTNSEILLAGAIAALTVDFIVYPVDTIKTRLQSRDYARLFRGNRSVLFRGLYQGVAPVVVATLPASGAFFTTYEGAKSFLASTNVLPQPVSHALASSVAELVSCAILTPSEVIKQNAQMLDRNVLERSHKNATMQTLARFRSNPLALWSGYTALAGRNLPFTALQFPMFERLKEILKGRREHQGKRSGTLLESATITAIASGSAGGVAAVLTTPVDVIKTRIMLNATDAATNTRSGWASITREIVAREGVRGLWRGGALRAVWTMLGSALYLATYESGRIWLASRRGEDLDEKDLL